MELKNCNDNINIYYSSIELIAYSKKWEGLAKKLKWEGLIIIIISNIIDIMNSAYNWIKEVVISSY